MSPDERTEEYWVRAVRFMVPPRVHMKRNSTFVERLDRQHRCDALVGLDGDEVDDRHAFGGAAGVWELVGLSTKTRPRLVKKSSIVRVAADEVLDARPPRAS